MTTITEKGTVPDPVETMDPAAAAEPVAQDEEEVR